MSCCARMGMTEGAYMTSKVGVSSTAPHDRLQLRWSSVSMYCGAMREESQCQRAGRSLSSKVGLSACGIRHRPPLMMAIYVLLATHP